MRQARRFTSQSCASHQHSEDQLRALVKKSLSCPRFLTISGAARFIMRALSILLSYERNADAEPSKGCSGVATWPIGSRSAGDPGFIGLGHVAGLWWFRRRASREEKRWGDSNSEHAQAGGFLGGSGQGRHSRR